MMLASEPPALVLDTAEDDDQMRTIRLPTYRKWSVCTLPGGMRLIAPRLITRGMITRGMITGALITAGIMMIRFTAQAAADDQPAIQVVVKHHQFAPAEIHVPTGRAVVLMVINHDDTAEEFDSTALKVEKVIAAGHHATIQLRPLGPGRYPFKGEYHPDTANGVVVSG